MILRLGKIPAEEAIPQQRRLPCSSRSGDVAAVGCARPARAHDGSAEARVEAAVAARRADAVVQVVRQAANLARRLSGTRPVCAARRRQGKMIWKIGRRPSASRQEKAGGVLPKVRQAAAKIGSILLALRRQHSIVRSSCAPRFNGQTGKTTKDGARRFEAQFYNTPHTLAAPFSLDYLAAESQRGTDSFSLFGIAGGRCDPAAQRRSTAAATQPIVQETALPIVAPNAQNGGDIYIEKCAPCHGETGMGDGPQASALSIPPSALGDPQVARAAAPAEWFQNRHPGQPGALHAAL